MGSFTTDTWKKTNPKPFRGKRAILMPRCLYPVLLNLNNNGGSTISQLHNVINHPQPQHHITTDASLTGWGLSLRGCPQVSFRVETPRQLFGMLAILLGLQTFAKGKSNTHMRIMCDNTTTGNVINHMGTGHSHPCFSVVREIWERCIARQIWISAALIPGKNNLIADFESRRNQRESK